MATPSRPAFPRFFLWLLPLSFVLQLAAIAAFHQYRTRPGDDHFEFGWEMGRVGRSIALGQGFSSPYEGDTGPTAWEPPLYPYLIGAVFKVFGIYTQASAWVLLSINSLFATLTCIPIFFIAQRTFGRTHCILVGGHVGAVSLRVVLVGPLDLGHDFYAARSGLSIPARAGTAGLAGLARLDPVWRFIWRGRAGQSHHAGIPALLRTVDLAAAIPARACLPWAASYFRLWCFFSGADALGRTQLRSVRTLRLSPRRFRIADPPGQRPVALTAC